MLVSVATTVWSLTILAGLTWSGVSGAGVANVAATLAGIPWSYWLNRRYVWRRAGDHDVLGEVVPFVAMCLVALVASTVAVTAADRWAAGLDASRAVRTLVVLTTNVLTFGALWVAQFVVLDRVLFAGREPRPNGPKVRGSTGSGLLTVQMGVGAGPTGDVDPPVRRTDGESEHRS